MNVRYFSRMKTAHQLFTIENAIEDGIDPKDGENNHRFLLLIWTFGGGGRRLGRRRL